MTVEYIYDDAYLGWSLGEDHPTNPIRAYNALEVLRGMEVEHTVVAPSHARHDDLRLVHDDAYLQRTHRGVSEQWDGVQPEVAAVGRLMAGGTIDAARRILTGQTRRAFNPQGAKHHAQRDRSSGFCVYNDMAVAATILADAGQRVFYLDWDAHHGDGVEFLLEHRDDVLTASIHNGTIFPGTGQRHRPDAYALNYPLAPRSDNSHLWSAVGQALEEAAWFRPDVLLLATGADGHEADPLGNLAYTLAGYAHAADEVCRFADRYCDGRILAGGAGGYRPHDWTPAVWATVFTVMTSPRLIPNFSALSGRPAR
jgi:acetoin utilization protein AcuC